MSIMRKGIAILGSTGSIGRQAIEVCRALDLRVSVLAAGSSEEVMFEQIKACKPELAVLDDPVKASKLRSRCSEAGLKLRVEGGRQAVIDAARDESCDLVIAAMVGMAGLEPVLAAIEAGRDIALANKETLVVGGNLVMKKVREKGVRLLPVDSEHSAIWQCLAAGRDDEVLNVYLTCSGGPFFGRDRASLEGVTAEEALAHPTWNMGGKISIDSATLMNKGLELIEACHLFGLCEDQVEIVIHPESIIHSMVGFKDHSVITQLGFPDMRLPIQLALTYPKRLKSLERRFDPFAPEANNLHFYKPDEETFYALRLARTAQREGRNLPIILNAANEKAVGAFLDGKIAFNAITDICSETMDKLSALNADYTGELGAILELNEMAAKTAGELISLCSK